MVAILIGKAMLEKGPKPEMIAVWGAFKLMQFQVVTLVSVRRGVKWGANRPPKDERNTTMPEMVVVFVVVVVAVAVAVAVAVVVVLL